MKLDQGESFKHRRPQLWKQTLLRRPRALHTDAFLCFTNEPLSLRQHSIKISSHLNRCKRATDGVRTRQVHFKPAQELSASLSLKMKTLNLPRKEDLHPRTRNF